MKKKITTLLILLSISFTGYCKIWTISSSGILFTPATLTISLGDTVNFVVAGSHDAKEVSLATWNQDGNTALSGGFQTSFGGGMVLPSKLTEGTHYYVCTPHAQFGMKAQIIVTKPTTTGIDDAQSITNVIASPNPSTGLFNFSFEDTKIDVNSVIEVYNLQGELIYQSEIVNSKINIDLSNQPNGVYIVEFYNGNTITTKKVLKY